MEDDPRDAGAADEAAAAAVTEPARDTNDRAWAGQRDVMVCVRSGTHDVNCSLRVRLYFVFLFVGFWFTEV